MNTWSSTKGVLKSVVFLSQNLSHFWCSKWARLEQNFARFCAKFFLLRALCTFLYHVYRFLTTRIWTWQTVKEIVDTEHVVPCHSVHSGYFLRSKKNAVVQKLRPDLMMPMEAKTFEKSILPCREKKERDRSKMLLHLILRYTRSLFRYFLWARLITIPEGTISRARLSNLRIISNVKDDENERLCTEGLENISFQNVAIWILIEEKSIRLDVDRFESLSLFGGWGFKSVLLSWTCIVEQITINSLFMRKRWTKKQVVEFEFTQAIIIKVFCRFPYHDVLLRWCESPRVGLG